MSAIQERINEIKENGYNLNFGKSFNDAFRLWQNLFGYGALAYFLFAFFYFLLVQVANLLPFMKDIQNDYQSIINEFIQTKDIQAYIENVQEMQANMAGNTEVLFTSIFILLLMSIIYPVIAGIVYMAFRFDKDGTTSFSYLFEGFNGNRFGNLVLLYLIYRICSFIGMAIFGVGFIIPFVGFALGSCFILFDDMSAFQAIKASFQVAYKKFFMVLILLLLSWVFGFIGVFGCIIGSFFTMPLTAIMCYVIYKSAVGISITSDMDELGNIQNS